MLKTGFTDTGSAVPYWNEIKQLNKEEKLKLIALISASLVSDAATDCDGNESIIGRLSPELMQGLAEYGVKESRAGRCVSHDSVEDIVMEAMGWK